MVERSLQSESHARHRFLVQVSEWYYLEGLNQGTIARRLDISRSTVSRLLAEAQAKGVVQVTIHRDPPVHPDLAHALIERFGLDDAIVVSSGTKHHMLELLGRQGARAIEARLRSSSTLAISYGTSVYATVRAIGNHHFATLEIVQMAAVEGVRNPLVDGWELVRMCADRLGARYQYLHAPLFVGSTELREALVNDPEIRRCLDRAADADVAVVGIGSMDPRNSSLVRAGHMVERDLVRCGQAGSVGYICGHHYDQRGAPIDQLNDRTVSLDLYRLRDMRYVIGVAAGVDKWKAIKGALQGGYLDVLITDVVAARAIIKEATVKDNTEAQVLHSNLGSSGAHS